MLYMTEYGSITDRSTTPVNDCATGEFIMVACCPSITDMSATSVNDDDNDWFIGLLVMDHMLCHDSLTCIHLYSANWDSTILNVIIYNSL